MRACADRPLERAAPYSPHERKGGKQLVDVPNQFGVQSLCADNCLARVVARKKAEDCDGSGGRHPMAIGTLVVRLTIVLVDHQFGWDLIQLKPKLEFLYACTRGI